MLESLLRRIGSALLDVRAILQGGKGGEAQREALALIDCIMREYHFNDAAQEWLRSNIRLRVDDMTSTRGGGYWRPQAREVHLFTAQAEAAVHELAHAWWHFRRRGREQEMIDAVVRLSEETDPGYRDMARLAYGYVHGIPEQNWKGMLVDRNDWEMFAGLASGSMGDMRKLPPYVRRLYAGLFKMPEEQS